MNHEMAMLFKNHYQAMGRLFAFAVSKDDPHAV